MISISRKALAILLLSYAAVKLLAIWPVKCCQREQQREKEEQKMQFEEEAREQIKNTLNKLEETKY